MNASAPIGPYLIDRLKAAGLTDIFGVPGDYVLRFYKLLSESPIRLVGTTREDTAAFAADGYARCRGIGALAVTYGVGALNVVNAVAGAYAESSPVVVISGAPGVREQLEDPLIHHRFGPFEFQRQIFERITCASAVLDDPYTACRQIDRVLSALREQCKPVYIELPRDQVDALGFPTPPEPERIDQADTAALREAIEETRELLGAGGRLPVLLAGQEVHRRGLQQTLRTLVDRTQLPIAATLTGKSVMTERHPCYLGIYEGAMGSAVARARVEAADPLLMLGVTLNDVDLGVYTARLDPTRMIRASGNEVFIRHHRYPRVSLRDFVQALTDVLPVLPEQAAVAEMGPSAPDFPRPQTPITVERLVARLNMALEPGMTVVSDIGDCLFGAIELRVDERSEFIAAAFYTSMGFAVPAALGAKVAQPDRRTLVLVGDGAFQMTGTELSTIARLGHNTIVVVFNNRGYNTERFILDGPFNDIANWQYDLLGAVMGPLRGFEADSEETFEVAWNRAMAERFCPSLINVHLQPGDASAAVRRLGESLGKSV